MNRKIALLNLALLALVGLLVWQLRVRRQEAAARSRLVLSRETAEQALLAPPPPAPVLPVAPAEYIEPVQKMLFSKDRNPNVICGGAARRPRRLRRRLCLLCRAIRPDPFWRRSGRDSELGSSSEQKGYAIGDKIGGFKVLAFDPDSITFEWNGGPVVKDLSDMRPKDAQALPASSARARAAYRSPMRSSPSEATVDRWSPPPRWNPTWAADSTLQPE